MIVSFRSKALKRFWESGGRKLLNAQHVAKIQIILDALDAAVGVEEMNSVGMDFHKLSGFSPIRWSVHVNGNWCITFSFDAGEAFDVDYEDYH